MIDFKDEIRVHNDKSLWIHFYLISFYLPSGASENDPIQFAASSIFLRVADDDV